MIKSLGQKLLNKTLSKVHFFIQSVKVLKYSKTITKCHFLLLKQTVQDDRSRDTIITALVQKLINKTFGNDHFFTQSGENPKT